MKKILFCLMLAPLAFLSATASAYESFTQNLSYTDQVISTAPLKILYTLRGATTRTPADLPGTIDRMSDLAYQGKFGGTSLRAPTYIITNPNKYSWQYASKSLPNFMSITPADGSNQPISFDYISQDGVNFQMTAQFLVSYAPGFLAGPYDSKSILIAVDRYRLDDYILQDIFAGRPRYADQESSTLSQEAASASINPFSH